MDRLLQGFHQYNVRVHPMNNPAFAQNFLARRKSKAWGMYLGTRTPRDRQRRADSFRAPLRAALSNKVSD